MRFSVGYLSGLAAFALAIVWVWYDRSLERRRHLFAGLADMCLIGLGGLVVLGYTEDRTALLWAMGGGGLGTYLASRFLG